MVDFIKALNFLIGNMYICPYVLTVIRIFFIYIFIHTFNIVAKCSIFGFNYTLLKKKPQFIMGTVF